MIGLIYEGIMDDGQWNLALSRIAGLADAAGVGLGMQDMRTHQFRDLGAHGIDPSLHHTYRRLAPGNQVWQEIGRRRRPMSDQMVMPKEAFTRTELFADWFEPQGFRSVMAHPTLSRSTISSVLVAFRGRSQGEFEPDDLATISRFAGHFGRALGVRLGLERMVRELFLANQMLDDVASAIFLVDRNLGLRHANAAGRRSLEARKGLRLDRGLLTLQDPMSDARLQRLAAEGRGGELRVASNGSPGMVLYIHPSVDGFGEAGCMTVRIVDLAEEREPPTPARLSARLGLSPRQAQVVAELASGQTEAEAAQKLKLPRQPSTPTSAAFTSGSNCAAGPNSLPCLRGMGLKRDGADKKQSDVIWADDMPDVDLRPSMQHCSHDSSNCGVASVLLRIVGLEGFNNETLLGVCCNRIGSSNALGLRSSRWGRHI